MRLSVSFFYYLLNNVGFRLLRFVALILCARLLTIHDFGILSTLFSLISIFGAISVFGMHNTVIKFAEETARGGANQFRHLLKLSFGANLLLGLVFGALMIVLKGPISHYLGVPESLILIASATIIPWAACRTMTFVFRALREPKKSLAVDVTGPALFILVLLTLIGFHSASLTLILTGNLLAVAFPVIIGFSLLGIFIRKLPTPAHHTEQRSLSHILSFSFFAFIATISGLSGSEIDRLLLAWFLDPQAVGQYNAAARTAFQLNIFYISFSYAFAPQVVKEHLDQETSRDKDYKRALLLFWLAAPIYIAAIGLGKYVMLLFGRGYLPALGVFLIIAVGGYVNLLLGPSEVYLRMRGFQKVEALNMILSMIITLTLDLLLIPQIGMYGAAFGSTVGFVAFKILSTIYAVQHGFIRLPKRTWWKILYVLPSLWGAIALDHPLILAALVLVSITLFFVMEQVPIKELAETMKAIINPPAAPRAQTLGS